MLVANIFNQPNPRGTTNDPMFSITRVPTTCKSFLTKIRTFLGKDSVSSRYVCELIVAIAFLFDTRSMRNVSGLFGDRRSRQSYDKFFNESDCDCAGLLRAMAFFTLRKLGWTPRERLYFVVDDTQIDKRGKKMEGVCRTFLHSEKRYADAHTVVTGCIVYRGVAVPYATSLFLSNKGYPELTAKYNLGPRKKLTELAAEMIESLEVPEQTKVVVLFDKYFLAARVLEACKNRGFSFVGAVKSNRIFKPNGSTYKQKINEYIPGLLRRGGRKNKIHGSSKVHYFAKQKGWLSKVGAIDLVCSRRENERTILTLATNDSTLSAKEVVEAYRNRWAIEVLFKDAKQHLGLGDYQLLKYQAVEKYLQLVMCAHCLLTHQAKTWLDEKEKNNENNSECFSIYRAKTRLRETIAGESIRAICESKRYKNCLGTTVRKIIATIVGKEYTARNSV